MESKRNCAVSLRMIVFIMMLALMPGAKLCAQITYYAPPAKGTTKPLTADADVPYKNLRVLEEYSDGKGNIVRKIQYTQGMMKVTETIIMPRPVKVGYRVAVNPDTLIKDSVVVIVSKSSYNVQVKYRNRVIRSYKAVFGPRPQDNKCMEGDRATPEGWFTITNKNPASKYTKFMGISYPNDSAYARFNKMKATGAIPSSARIGGSVGIHGIWNGGDNLIELGVGWTDGCVALKNQDIEDLYTLVGVGTKVYIRK